MSKKFYVFMMGSFFSTVVFFVLGAFAFSMTKKENPQIVEKLTSGKGIQISFQNDWNLNSQAPSQSTDGMETWAFKEKVETLELSGITADWKLTKIASDETVVTANGDLDKSLAPSRLRIELKNGQLRVQGPKNEDSVKNLQVQIQISTSTLEKIVLNTVSGDALLSSVFVANADIKTVSGDVSIQRSQIGDISFNAVSGNLSIDNSSINSLNGHAISADLDLRAIPALNLNWESVSGQVKIKFLKDAKAEFRVKTISGEVNNSLGSVQDSSQVVSVKSVSGDIEIE